MSITLTQEDLYDLAFAFVRKQGFRTAGIVAYNEKGKQLSDEDRRR